jgi:hypothetical protein
VRAAQLLCPEPLVVYDLRDPAAWEAASRHRGFWGRLYTDIVALDELEETRQTAERELAALQSRREALEQLELDKEALLEHYARIAPEALDSLALEERHRLYKMLRLEVAVRPDSSLEIRGVFRGGASLSDSELVPRYECQNTKSPEWIFRALMGDDGARDVRFDRALST